MKKVRMAVSLIILLTGIAFADEKSDNKVEKDENKVIAMGDGFVITQKHLTEFEGFYAKKFDFSSNEKEYRNAITRLWAFAMEAKTIGLDKEAKEKKLEEEPMERLITLQDLYVNKITDEFPVSDLAIESYYWAHPDYFQDVKDKSDTPVLYPLTPGLKEKIRKKIAEGKKADLILKHAEDIKSKYHVRLCTEGVCK